MASEKWKSQSTIKELDEHMDNAFKRVSGIVGYQLGRDRMNLESLTGTAQSALENLASPGPMFMRLAGGLGAAAGLRPKTELSLKELAAEILNEFFSEATGAFQAARVRLHNEAEAWLRSRGVSDECRVKALGAADESLLNPSREDMTRAALGFVKEGLSPGTAGIIGGFGGFGLIVATLRHPVLAIAGAVVGAALLYYLARKSLRKKTDTLLVELPQAVYKIFRAAFIANQDRYQDIINRAAEKE